MNATIISLAIVTLLAISNITSVFGKNNPQIYKNTVENKIENSSTTCLYEGVDDMNLTPIKKYITEYSTTGTPISKTHFIWDSLKDEWQTQCKYEYEYDNKENVIGINYTEWNPDLNCWKNNSHYAMYPDTKGKGVGTKYTAAE